MVLSDYRRRARALLPLSTRWDARRKAPVGALGGAVTGKRRVSG
ncbi:hypothetical protein [Streptomyces axinellae]